MTKIYAYEIDDGHGGHVWAVMSDDILIDSVPADDFGNRLDFYRAMHYDVYINTLESWEAM